MRAVLALFKLRKKKSRENVNDSVTNYNENE